MDCQQQANVLKIILQISVEKGSSIGDGQYVVPLGFIIMFNKKHVLILVLDMLFLIWYVLLITVT